MSNNIKTIFEKRDNNTLVLEDLEKAFAKYYRQMSKITNIESERDRLRYDSNRINLFRIQKLAITLFKTNLIM